MVWIMAVTQPGTHGEDEKEGDGEEPEEDHHRPMRKAVIVLLVARVDSDR